MHTSSLILLLAAITTVTAQSTFSTILRDNPELSTLQTLISQYPSIVQAVADPAYGKRTFLAPSNTAFRNSIDKSNSSGGPAVTDAEALLSYHLLNGSFTGADLNSPGGIAAKTFLRSPEYNNLGPGGGGGGNVVYAGRYGSAGTSETPEALKVYSGVGEAAAVNKTDLSFDNGYVHIIDDLLALPQTCTGSMAKFNLNSLLLALNTADLANAIDNKPGVTCFAPSQEAFAAAGSPEKTLSPDALKSALLYHTLDDTRYSPDLKTGVKYPTLQSSQTITIVREGGSLYIQGSGGDKAKVIRGNVIVKNGVMHVIDRIISPGPSPNATTTGGSSSTRGSTPDTSVPRSGSTARVVNDAPCLFGAVIAVIMAVMTI